MPGGMWGAKLDNHLGPNRWDIADAATKLFQNKTDKLVKGLDHQLLGTHIWPIVNQNLVKRRKKIRYSISNFVFDGLDGARQLLLRDPAAREPTISDKTQSKRARRTGPP